jgi:flagellar basal-body rod modification protein FlgD
MDVAAAGTGAGTTAGVAGSTRASGGIDAFGDIGKDAFLKLLVAQLRNQDPFKPMDDKDFIAQLAQMNTVEQMSNMNNYLKESLSFEAMGQASALIGKTIVAQPPGMSPITGVVQEVRLVQGTPMLIVAGQAVGLDEVQRISAGR